MCLFFTAIIIIIIIVVVVVVVVVVVKIRERFGNLSHYFFVMTFLYKSIRVIAFINQSALGI